MYVTAKVIAGQWEADLFLHYVAPSPLDLLFHNYDSSLLSVWEAGSCNYIFHTTQYWCHISMFINNGGRAFISSVISLSFLGGSFAMCRSILVLLTTWFNLFVYPITQ